MADSLFDNRYRYDYIYPRGRSGETLRAVDTERNDRPVVIKRPAPNDAPPIRAGQEVSILNERKALMRLAGHPVLTEFLDGGQFFVGGMPHQYIVMERAEGAIIEEMVLELARQGEHLPQLEMLVVIDGLLDLLQTAHTKDIVYNDVDAKHLFWDRDRYRLKVIDWGNAVFLEGDEVTPQGVSRQSDITQVGELLYFMLTGGGRPEIPRVAEGEAFVLDFGEDAERVSPTLQAIVSQALHPNPRQRYSSITELRRELERYRGPIERERDSVLNHVDDRLRRDLSKNDLRSLLNTLQPALEVDPGHPGARRALAEINSRLDALGVAADLDAVRIYMQGSNWGRAAELLDELRERADGQTSETITLLLDCTVLLVDTPLDHTPEAITEGIDLIFDGHFVQAAQTLLTAEPENEDERRLCWLLAERISSHIPEVMLLRPNLYRLDQALKAIAVEGVNINDARALMAEIQDMLDDMPGRSRLSLAELRDGYRAVVDRLSTLNKLLSTVVVQQNLPNRKLPLSSLDRSLNAAMALADNMHVIGKQATTSPRDALVALDNSRAIDPTNSLWRAIFKMLNGLYELLQSYQTYVPTADGSDLAAWLDAAQKDLAPFLNRLFDDLLAGMVDGLNTAAQNWEDYAQAVIAGNRAEAMSNLTQAAEAVETVSPTLAGWLKQLRSVVNGANYIERHAIFGGLGRALADGWEAFDRGRLADAERLGQQAVEIARDQRERDAAQRLLTLAGVTREWVERNGALNARRTETALAQVEDLFTQAEITSRENFAAQMPSRETYLRAMQKGIVETYHRSSTAAVRLFFIHAVLQGTLEAHEGNLPDARFWQDVAVRIYAQGSNQGSRHPATRTLEDFIERRRDITAASRLFNEVNGTQALANLESIRRQVEENPQARVLAAGIHSLRELELAQRDWADGEFRAAGLKLENAINALGEVEQAAEITLTPYRAWLVELQAAAAELHNLARQMRQAIERRPADPPQIVYVAHQRHYEDTAKLLGEQNAQQIKTWYETYAAFVEAYTDQHLRRSARLERFNELFKAMFIDRHPAYPLYRHWYDLTDNAPEFPAPPTDDPTPQIDDTVDESEYLPPEEDDEAQPKPRREERPPRNQTGGADDAAPPRGRQRGFPLRLLIIVGGLVLVGVIAVLVLGGLGDDDDGGAGGIGLQLTLSDTPDATGTALALATAEVTEAITDEPDTATDEAEAPDSTPRPNADIEGFSTPTPRTPTAQPTDTDSPPTATETPAPTNTPTDEPPTATNTPTPTPTLTDTPTNTPTPTLPPNGLQGQQDMLALIERIPPEDYPWDSEVFSLDPNGTAWRLGTGTETDSDEIQIMFSPGTLDTYYGNDAPTRVRQTDATISLVTFNSATLEPSEVYFGMMLQSADDPAQQVGLHIQVENLNTVNLYIREGENERFVVQRSVNTVTAQIRLDRDVSNGRVTIYFNDRQVGDPVDFTAPDAPLVPVLYVNDGGVITSVSRWRVNLR